MPLCLGDKLGDRYVEDSTDGGQVLDVELTLTLLVSVVAGFRDSGLPVNVGHRQVQPATPRGYLVGDSLADG
jgi:hypothetical protein